MKIIIVLALVALAAAQDSTYTTKYDGIDVMKILTEQRLFKNYFNCLVDAGPCTPEGTELKKYLPDAIVTGCAKCTDTQREKAVTVAKYLMENYPSEWTALKAKFDPDNKFADLYRDEAAKYGLKL